MTTPEPPEHVRATFGLRDMSPVPLGEDWDGGWRCGDVVLSPVVDNARAAWSSRIRETLVVDGMRLARPVRATDGRYVVSGWSADTFIAGIAEPRHDEVVSLSLRLHAATIELDRPRFLAQPPIAPWSEADIFLAADRAAWEQVPLRSVRAAGVALPESADGQRSVTLLGQLATLRREVSSPPQLVHGDLFGTVLFAGAMAPGLADITPYWRPVPWAAAVIAVDSLAWGGADEGLLERWDDLPEWPQMLIRAVMFRLAVHALHPRSQPDALPGLTRVADLIRLMV